MKYIEWLNEWMENYVGPAVRIGTYQKYRQIANLHIAPSLGEYDLDELNPIIYQKFVTALLTSGSKKTGKGMSADAVNLIISVLQSSLRTACAVGLKKAYDANKIRRPKITEKTVDSFSFTEQKAIESAILSKRPRMFGVLLCLYTGLRVGELLALEWDDIDLKKGTLSVNKSCHYGKNEKGVYTRIVGKPKTPQSNRIIPLPKQLLPYIKEAKAKSLGKYVAGGKGKPVSVRSYQRSFGVLLEELKIPHKCFHALRHTFATRAIESGTDVKTLSEILGHKNAAVTLNRYVHSLLEHKRETMNRLGKFCGL